MAFIDWILVAFGVGIAVAGGWIQLHPERVLPSRPADAEQPWSEAMVESAALSQVRLIGASLLAMGTFFALQMTIDLTRLPWWMGTISGAVLALVGVGLVRWKVRGQRRRGRYYVQQGALPKKVLELR